MSIVKMATIYLSLSFAFGCKIGDFEEQCPPMFMSDSKYDSSNNIVKVKIIIGEEENGIKAHFIKKSCPEYEKLFEDCKTMQRKCIFFSDKIQDQQKPDQNLISDQQPVKDPKLYFLNISKDSSIEDQKEICVLTLSKSEVKPAILKNKNQSIL